MKRECGLRIFEVLLLFTLMLGAWLFYLHYEGIMKYQYVLPDSPDLVLTTMDAAEIVLSEQEENTVTEYNLGQKLVYRPQIPVSIVKVAFSQLPEGNMDAKMHAVNVHGEQIEIEKMQKKRIGDSEILFAFPQIRPDEIHITVVDAKSVGSIEIYENGVYIDEAKETPRGLNTGIAFLLAALFAMAYLTADAELLKGKGLVFPALFFVLEWAVMSFCLQTRSYETYSRGFECLTYLMFTLASLVLCVVYRMLFVWHFPLHGVFAVSGLTMGIVMMLLIQPYTVPDEQTHFYQAYRLSNRMLGRAAENLQEIRWEDVRFQEEQLGFYGVTNSYERYASLADGFKWMNESKEMKQFNAPVITSVPLGYVVTGTAVSAARLMNLSGVALFYLGRLMNLLVFVALITIAIYLVPFGKAAIICVAAAPVSMQLAASYSYDPIVTALAFLYVAYVLRLWAQKPGISLRQYMVCLGLALLLAPSKIAYAPMTATVFLISKGKYTFGGKYKWLINPSLVAASFIVLLCMQMSIIGRVSQTGEVQWAGDVQGYSLIYLIKNIKETISLYMNTFQEYLDGFIVYLFCEKLGWHQLDAHGWLTIVFFIIFCAGCQRTEKDSQVCCTPCLRWGVSVVMAMTVAITMLSMLLDHTPIGNGLIAGVQGRYFIPIMILFIPLLRNMQIQITEKAICWCSFTTLWASMLAAIRLLQVMP